MQYNVQLAYLGIYSIPDVLEERFPEGAVATALEYWISSHKDEIFKVYEEIIGYIVNDGKNKQIYHESVIGSDFFDLYKKHRNDPEQKYKVDILFVGHYDNDYYSDVAPHEYIEASSRKEAKNICRKLFLEKYGNGRIYHILKESTAKRPNIWMETEFMKGLGKLDMKMILDLFFPSYAL